MSLQVSAAGLAYRAKGKIRQVSDKHTTEAEVRIYGRLFSDPNPNPDADGKDFKDCLNPNSKEVITAYLEQGMAKTLADEKFQLVRRGYFVADRGIRSPPSPCSTASSH